MSAAGFESLVLDWLVRSVPGTADAVRVLAVTGEGFDEPHTIGGAGFGVTITYQNLAGSVLTCEVDGKQMQSLWDAVVAGWPG